MTDISVTMEELSILHRLKSDVYDRSKKVDPNNERDWYDLTYGYLLASGLTPKRAEKFTLLVCYNNWLEQLPPPGETPEQREKSLAFHRELWSKLPEADRDAVQDCIFDAMETLKKKRPKTLRGLTAFQEAYSILVYAALPRRGSRGHGKTEDSEGKGTEGKGTEGD